MYLILGDTLTKLLVLSLVQSKVEEVPNVFDLHVVVSIVD